MGRRYSSFVMRVWQPSEKETRVVEVEHVQSGAHVRLDSLLAATVWLASHCGVSQQEAEMQSQSELEKRVDGSCPS